MRHIASTEITHWQSRHRNDDGYLIRQIQCTSYSLVTRPDRPLPASSLAWLCRTRGILLEHGKRFTVGAASCRDCFEFAAASLTRIPALRDISTSMYTCRSHETTGRPGIVPVPCKTRLTVHTMTPVCRHQTAFRCSHTIFQSLVRPAHNVSCPLR